MDAARSSLPAMPSTPGGPFGAPVARRVQQLNGGAAAAASSSSSKRAKHPLATSFHLPALDTPPRPNDSLASNRGQDSEVEKAHVSSDNARWSLSMLAAGVCHQAGFDNIVGGALAELTTELERYLLDVFDTARSLSESCGRRRPQARDLLEVLLVAEGSSHAIYVVEDKAADGAAAAAAATGSVSEKQAPSTTSMTVPPVPLNQRRGYVGLALGQPKSTSTRTRSRPSSRSANFGQRKVDDVDVVARMRKVMRTWTRARKQGRRAASPHVLGREDVPPSPPRPAMIVLPSDERGDTATGQTGADADTRRLDVAEDLSWVPELPPRHTWKRTRLVKAEKTPAANKSTHASVDESAVTGRLSDSALDYLFHAVSMRSGATLAPELDVVPYHRTARAKDKDAERSRAKATAYAEALRRAAEDGGIEGSSSSTMSTSSVAAAMTALRAKRRLNAGRHQHHQQTGSTKRRWVVPGLEQKRVIRLKVAARSAK